MRKIVPECRAFDSTPIKEIAIDPRMRGDMSAALKGLQCVYGKAESRAALFSILEAHFQPGTRRVSDDRAWIYGASSCLR